MACRFCKSENTKLFKEGIFHTGFFCNDCGAGDISYTSNSCCENQNLTDIKFEQANGTWVQRVACKSCKSLIGGAKKKSNDFDKLQPYYQEKYLQIESDRIQSRIKLSEFLKKLSDEFKEKQTTIFWKQYNAYLKTPQWQYKRQQVLERAGYQCEGCRISKAVHVHHTTYENLYDELLFQLVALCVSCHNKLHPDKTF